MCGPTLGTAGGILCAWNPVNVSRTNEIIGKFSTSVILKDLQLGCDWLFIRVYGPASTTNRDEFLEELKGLKNR